MIRVTPKTSSIINAVVNQMKAQRPGDRITQDEAVQIAFRLAFPDAVAFIEKASTKPHVDKN